MERMERMESAEKVLFWAVNAVVTHAEKFAPIEAGFEYVMPDRNGTQYFRKRK